MILLIAHGQIASAAQPLVVEVVDESDAGVPRAAVSIQCGERVERFTTDLAGTPWVTPFTTSEGPCEVTVEHPFLMEASLHAGVPVQPKLTIHMSTCGENVMDAPRRRRRCRRAARKYDRYLRPLARM